MASDDRLTVSDRAAMYQESQARVEALEKALAECLIPLKALQLAVKWELADSVKWEISKAVEQAERLLLEMRK